MKALEQLKNTAISVAGSGGVKGLEYIDIKIKDKNHILLGRDAYLVALGIAYALSEIDRYENA